MSTEPTTHPGGREATKHRPTCLFLGSFDKRYDVLFSMLVEPVARDCGYSAVDATELYQSDRITPDLVQRIESAELVIADIGRESLNVCYEIGVRHATGKPCLLIGCSDAIPFYFRDLVVTRVDEGKVGSLDVAKRKLRDRVEKARDQRRDLSNHPVLGAIPPPRTPLAHSVPPPTGRMYGFEHFPKRIEEYLETHAGHLYIYNIEFNTLEPTKINEGFWKLLHHKNVGSRTIAIPPDLFRRLELWLGHLEFGPKVAEMLGDVRIVPVAIPDEYRRLAFARFAPSNGSDARSWAFPKIPFYSEWERYEALSNDFENPGHWAYRHVIESADVGLNQSFKQLFPRADTNAFLVEDVRTLAVGNPETPESIATQHGLVGRPKERACSRIKNCIHLNDQRFDALRPCEEPIRAPQDGCTVFQFPGQDGQGWALHSLTPEATKPVLLWVPPWSHADWRQRVNRLDAELTNAYSVVHLTLSGLQRYMTFSAALCDIRQAVRQIQRGIKGLAADRTRIALVGVGVNAYLTVEAAAQIATCDSSALLGLCLLAPAIDLFEAVDRFHNRRTALFTRKVYMAKPAYRLGLLALGPGLTYLGHPIEVDHLLDLRARGSRACGRAYFRENIRTLVDKGNPMFIGSSPLSELAEHNAISAIVRELGSSRVKHVELPWYVEIQQDGGGLRCDMSLEQGGGLAEALRFLKEHSGRPPAAATGADT